MHLFSLASTNLSDSALNMSFRFQFKVLTGKLVQKFTHFINHQKSNDTFPIHGLVLNISSVLLMFNSYSIIYTIQALPFGLGGMITALIAGDIVAWAVRFRASLIELIDASRRRIFSLELKMLQLVVESWLDTYQFQRTIEFWSSWIESFVLLQILLEIDKREKQVVQSRNHFAQFRDF